MLASLCWPCDELPAHLFRVFLICHTKTAGVSSRNRHDSDHRTGGDVGMQTAGCLLQRTCKALIAVRTRPSPESLFLPHATPRYSTTKAVVAFALYADDELKSLFSYLPDSPLSLSLLLLYILLGVVAGALVLCWCCWSPGWFVWRVSICRFLPCCNSVCASCQLCARSCTNSKEHRLAKVTPHTPTNGASTGAAAITHSADENVNMSAV